MFEYPGRGPAAENGAQHSASGRKTLRLREPLGLPSQGGTFGAIIKHSIECLIIRLFRVLCGCPKGLWSSRRSLLASAPTLRPAGHCERARQPGPRPRHPRPPPRRRLHRPRARRHRPRQRPPHPGRTRRFGRVGDPPPRMGLSTQPAGGSPPAPERPWACDFRGDVGCDIQSFYRMLEYQGRRSQRTVGHCERALGPSHRSMAPNSGKVLRRRSSERSVL